MEDPQVDVLSFPIAMMYRNVEVTEKLTDPLIISSKLIFYLLRRYTVRLTTKETSIYYDPT